MWFPASVQNEFCMCEFVKLRCSSCQLNPSSNLSTTQLLASALTSSEEFPNSDIQLLAYEAMTDGSVTMNQSQHESTSSNQSFPLLSILTSYMKNLHSIASQTVAAAVLTVQPLQT